MDLNWIKCGGGNWCFLSRVNLLHHHFMNLEGVYVIWHAGQNAATVYVGQGNIAERLTYHRTNTEILVYSQLGLFVTWAQVDSLIRDGVERFLIDRLQPKVNVRAPAAPPVYVNLPWP